MTARTAGQDRRTRRRIPAPVVVPEAAASVAGLGTVGTSAGLPSTATAETLQGAGSSPESVLSGA